MSVLEKFVMAAGNLVVGEHEIRPPGEEGFLPVTGLHPSPRGGEAILCAGGREFTTQRQTMWPVRLADADLATVLDESRPLQGVSGPEFQVTAITPLDDVGVPIESEA